MDRFDGEWYDTPRGYDGPFHVPGDDVNPNDYFDSVQWHQDEDLMRRQQDDAYYGRSRQNDEEERRFLYDSARRQLARGPL